MALATWEMVARVTRCHQMSRDVTRTWILLILLASMAWRCYDCYDYDMLQCSQGELWVHKSPTCSGRILKVSVLEQQVFIYFQYLSVTYI